MTFAAYSSGVIQNSFNRIETSDTSSESGVSVGPIIVASHGDWVTDDADVTGGTATNWFMVTHYNTDDYDISTYSYDTSTHTLTSLNHFNFVAGTSMSGGWSQTDGLFGGWGQRYFDGSGHPSIAYPQAINSNLTGLSSGSATHDSSNYIISGNHQGPYGSVFRLSDDMLVYVGSSGNSQGNYGIKTTDGNTSTNGGQNTNSPDYGGTGNWNPRDGSFGEPHFTCDGSTELSAIGGNGGSYSNPTTNYDYFYFTYGGSDTGPWPNAAANPVSGSIGTNTRVNFEVMSWDGNSGGQTRSYYGDVLTVPTHTGSTLAPASFWTTWGNVVLHRDTANPGNAVCFPITWSGTAPTAGSSVAWPGGTQIPADELHLDHTVRAGCGSGHKYGSGQHRTKLNKFRTLRRYESGGSTYFDFVEFEFNYSGGVLYPSAYTTVKQGWSYPKTGVGISGSIYMKNDTDIFVVFNNVNAGDNTEFEFVYFKGAFSP